MRFYMTKTKTEKAAALIIEFTVYSFIGWLYETILTSAAWGHFADRGVLHLPICPIYGFCAIALLLIFHRLRNIPLIFILGTVLTTAAELAASYILERFTTESLWDYSHWAFNFQGRIALGSSLIFGVLCVILIRLLHPAAEYLTGKSSGRILKITAAVLLLAILADVLAVAAGY